MLPQYYANYNNIFLRIIFADCIYKKVTLARLNIDFLMTVCMDRNM